jgi:hypothetical protein
VREERKEKGRGWRNDVSQLLSMNRRGKESDAIKEDVLEQEEDEVEMSTR